MPCAETNTRIPTRRELGPQQNIYMFCLLSGKQRDPNQAKKKELILGKPTGSTGQRSFIPRVLSRLANLDQTR